jgi:hypothetical protein
MSESTVHLIHLSKQPDPSGVIDLDCSGMQLGELPKELLKCPKLERLDIGGSPDLDPKKVIESLTHFPSLRELAWARGHLTPKRFPAGDFARKLPSVRKLVLGKLYEHPLGNYFTAAEQQQLREQLPGVEIVFPTAADDIPELEDFGSTSPEAAIAGITDPVLKSLYWYLPHRPYRAWRYAESHGAESSDPLGAADGAVIALESIIKEHVASAEEYDWTPEEIVAEYGWYFGFWQPAELREALAGARARADALRKAGAKSEVGARYREIIGMKERESQEAAREFVGK